VMALEPDRGPPLPKRVVYQAPHDAIIFACAGVFI
jgi:hypothetical protein